MKINKIKINSFGKLRNKEIEFKNGINILYGENESGKSTIMNFIKNTLYGISKNKKGKEISDYDKYKPWGKEEFSGKLEYTLDNNEKYEIIYIGKAKALKNRVSQYFGSDRNHQEKVRRMVSNVDDFDYILTSSEFEALVLECSLIKQHQPKYNILLKDDLFFIIYTPGESGRFIAFSRSCLNFGFILSLQNRSKNCTKFFP